MAIWWSRSTLADSCYLLQLTDCHLAPEAGTLYRGYDADSTLGAAVVDAVAVAASRNLIYEHVLLTGDLVQHGGVSAYRRLLDLLAPLPAPWHWLPGNHDDSDVMAQLVTEPACASLQQKRIDCADWRLLLLDSTAQPDGRGSGSLGAAELAWLTAELEQAQNEVPAKHLLLVLHHNPLPTGSGWQDLIRLGDAEQFCALIRRYPQVRGVICGHLHQFQHWTLGPVQLFCAPSTVFQFKPGQDDLLQEDDPLRRAPGYSIYRLDSDGRISAEPHWLASD